MSSGVTAFAGSTVLKGKMDQELVELKGTARAIQDGARLRVEIGHLKAQHEGLQASKTQQEQELQQTRERVTQVIEALESRRQEQATALNAVRGEVAMAEARQQTLVEQVSGLSGERDRLNQAIETLERQRQEQATAFSTMRGDLATAEVQRRALIEKVAGLSGERDQLTQVIETLESQRQEQATALGGLRGELAVAEAQHQALTNQVTELSSQRDQLQQRVALINQQNPDLQQREELYRQIQKMQAEEGSLAAEVTRLQAQTEVLHARQQELQEIETQLSINRADYQDILGKLEGLKEQCVHYEQQFIELGFMRAAYDGLHQEKGHLEERIKVLQPEITRLDEQRARILEEIRRNEGVYQKLEGYRSQLEKIQEQLIDADKKLERVSRSVVRRQRDLDELQHQHSDVQQAVEQLRRRKDELEKEIHDIEESGFSALNALKNYYWKPQDIPQKQTFLGQSLQDEETFLERFEVHLQQQGFAFPQRVIRAFHTSLKVQDISALVILAGISGTGKSELPQRYARYIGAQQLTLAVQPRWDSPQDLQGFYNYIEKKYKPTSLMRGLWQYKEDPMMRDRMVIVLLDEMNLAKVEYYFSDFLSKLESRRSQKTYLEIEVGSLRLPEEDEKLPIPEEFLFVGTMNEDETTQSLSDKVLDRSNVLTFGRPQKLRLREESQGTVIGESNTDSYIPYSQFKQWIRPIIPGATVVDAVGDYLEWMNHIMEMMGHPFAHRVKQAITKYVVNYPGLNSHDSDSALYRQALADQVGQKLLPKLRGLMVDEYAEEIAELGSLIAELQDRSLIDAFNRAKDPSGGRGDFVWKGLVYESED